MRQRVRESPAVRTTVMDWEEAERTLGRTFGVVEWEHRFGMTRRTWTRWCVAARSLLGLRLELRQEREAGNNRATFRLTLQEWEVALLRRWVAALEDYLCRPGTTHKGFWNGLERAWTTRDDEAACA